MSPVYPVTFYPPALLGWYPHMARRDAVIWERFIRLRAREFVGFAYDVALGGLDVQGPDEDAAIRTGYRFSTAQRIDVVADRTTEHWIIEVRHQARISAVGAAMGYTMLALREPWTALPLVPTVVTDNISPDVRYVAELFNVNVVVVPEEPPKIL